MKNTPFEGAVEIGKPPSMTAEQCVPAYAMPFTQEIDVQPLDTEPDQATKKQTVQCFLLRYEPSQEDIQALLRGEPIWLKIMAPGLPPHAIWTMNPDTQKPNYEPS
jgi:hypothetical protein